MHDPFLFLVGAIGALIYAFPMYLASAGKVPPPHWPLATLIFAVFTGAVISALLVPTLGHRWDFLVQPEPYPLAFVVGLMANPMVPVVVRKLTGWAEAYNLGGKK